MKRNGRRWLGPVLVGLLVAGAQGCGSEDVPVQELFAVRNQGLLFLQRGQLPEAEEQFARLVDLAPNEPLGHANLGLTMLRAGRFDEAEPHLLRARRLDPGSVDIALMLARLYVLDGRGDEARELLEGLPRGPGDDARIAYALAELDEDASDPVAAGRYRDRLREVLSLAPASLPARLRLAEAYLRQGEVDSVVRQLEEIRRIPPEPPAELAVLPQRTLDLLGAGDVEGAAEALRDFHEGMEVTAPYQSSLADLGWVEGTLVGRPVLTFAPEDFASLRGLRDSTATDPVRFIEATAEAGLPGGGQGGGAARVVAAGDVDGDGRADLFVAGEGGAVGLYRVQAGQVQDVTEQAGIVLRATAVDATFADFDNDGWLDLFVVEEGGRSRLFRNGRDLRFEEVTATANLAETAGATAAAWLDADHDGDLDLVLLGEEGISVRRNNLDGTFSDGTSAFGLAGVAATSLGFADLDGDARVDLVVSGGDAGIALYLNEGGGRFRDATATSGLAAAGAAGAVGIGDLDNDGAFDLLVGCDRGEVQPQGPQGNPGGCTAGWWRGSRDGTFRRVPSLDRALGAAGSEAIALVDYDNDGWLDVVASGPAGSGALHLLRNDGAGGFDDRSAILPAGAGGGPVLVATDIDDDGDQDLLTAAAGGGIALLRNDGGNLNRAMRVELQALGAGSGKNNGFGVGSRLELRVGELLQTRVATGQTTHFGLGPHLKADVLRVEWPNGVPQILYFPGSDQDVLEIENLKGSCAFLYTWDGERFRFVTDVTWRSALGMPVGLMGTGSTLYAPAAASQEYLRIPGEALRPRDGRYVLQLTEELWETAYMDEVRLLTVDHPDSVEVYVDERFVPPGPVELRIYPTVRPRAPLSAVDGEGTDLLPALRGKDDVYVSNFTPTRYQGLVNPHDLILDLGAEAGRQGSLLLLRGWIYPTDASINVALSQQADLTPMPLSLEVRDAGGRWVTAIPNLFFPSGKDKTLVIELGGLFPTEDHRVRIRTNLQIYWDQAFVADEAPDAPLIVETLAPLSADLHFRGFSRMYRKGGRYGPHWFAYDDVQEESPWRPIRGSVTRFGDVRPLLGEPDDMYVIMAPGDETTVEFDAGSAEGIPAGWRRDFLLYTDGWIKDADLNTAFGDTVEPLPFHDIQQYPYAPGDSYPAGAEHREYLREYNTRVLPGR